MVVFWLCGDQGFQSYMVVVVVVLGSCSGGHFGSCGVVDDFSHVIVVVVVVRLCDGGMVSVEFTSTCVEGVFGGRHG